MAIGKTWFEVWEFNPSDTEERLIGIFNTLPAEMELGEFCTVFLCECGVDGQVRGEAL